MKSEYSENSLSIDIRNMLLLSMLHFRVLKSTVAAFPRGCESGYMDSGVGKVGKIYAFISLTIRIFLSLFFINYIESVEGHEYHILQVGIK